jgi:hypothetical protein
VLEVQPPLVPLLASLPGIAGVHAAGDPLPPFDRHCPMSSLPLAFATTLADVPAAVPYLAAPPERLRHWRAAVNGRSGLKVGLAWAGNPGHNNDHNRSLAIELLRPLLDTPGCHFFALQKALRPGDADALAGCDAVTLLGEQLGDFVDTAAIIAALDLVVSVDTAVAHLAGALGKPVWLLLPFSAEWRWLIGRADSPWYPTARLYRQPEIGAWSAAIAEVAAALERLAPRGGAARA